MFDYGKIYGSLSLKDVPKLGIGKYQIGRLSLLIRLYFRIFGYPDVAGHMRFKLINKNLSFKKNEKILDAGCGIGIYLHEFSNRYKVSGYGVDVRHSRISLNRKVDKYLNQNNIFLIQRLEKLNLGKTYFDKILCLEVLEHIKNDYLAVKRLYSYLKKHGVLLITVPMSSKENNSNCKAPEKYGHVREGYSYGELKSLFKKVGFSKVKIEPYFFLFSKSAVKIQHILYKRTPFYINALFSPLLTLIAYLDRFVKIYPRGYMVILKK